MTEIDVSECKYLEIGFVNKKPENRCVSKCANTTFYRCIDNPNCYYKQMKRLEVENAKLKEKLEETRKQVIRYRSYYCKGCYEITEENEKLKEKLKKIKEFVTPLCCNNPLDCWMNKDEGTGDIYGFEGDDYKGCPNGFASCILKIIEGAEDE